MVIVILGVIGGMVAVFMRGPIDAYFASARRAGLTDMADTTVRRMARDIHAALPNSIRTPENHCVEFIPTKAGGRYRAEGAGALNFATAVSTFNELGSNAARPGAQQIVENDIIVVYNLGIAGADAYAGNNTALVGTPLAEAGSPVETSIPIAATQFPLASGSNRFHVVPGGEPVVGYVCSGGRLFRYTHALPYAEPANCPAPAAATPVLATHVENCNFSYTGSDLQRNALVRMSLQLTDSGETVSLQHEVHVNNTP
jgi:MSHA biogenesis protein MshO